MDEGQRVSNKKVTCMKTCYILGTASVVYLYLILAVVPTTLIMETYSHIALATIIVAVLSPLNAFCVLQFRVVLPVSIALVIIVMQLFLGILCWSTFYFSFAPTFQWDPSFVHANQTAVWSVPSNCQLEAMKCVGVSTCDPSLVTVMVHDEGQERVMVYYEKNSFEIFQFQVSCNHLIAGSITLQKDYYFEPFTVITFDETLPPTSTNDVYQDAWCFSIFVVVLYAFIFGVVPLMMCICYPGATQQMLLEED